MIPLCNLHTHTTYCDGKNTAEEMVQAAIQHGAVTIGFSGHSPLIIHRTHEEWSMRVQQTKDYHEEILRLRQIWGRQIEILLGIEQDCFSEAPDFPYDYIIGSVHYVQKGDIYIRKGTCNLKADRRDLDAMYRQRIQAMQKQAKE